MPEIIPLFPLSHGLFPEGMLHLQIFEVRYLNLIKRCHLEKLPFGIPWIKNGSEVSVPGEKPSLHNFGCMAHIRKMEQIQPNFFQIVCQGGLLFELHDVQPGEYGVWQGSVTFLPHDPPVDLPESIQPFADRLGRVIASAQRRGQIEKLPIFPAYQLDQCGWLANRYLEAMDISVETKIKLLTELDPLKRMQAVASLLPPISSESV